MFRRFDRLTGHIAAIVIIWALVCLPSLGVPSLWDIDEGNNFECVREMIEADNWVVPTFNCSLRTDKPALLYWLQIAAASVIGLNEWAAAVTFGILGAGCVADRLMAWSANVQAVMRVIGGIGPGHVAGSSRAAGLPIPTPYYLLVLR
jgi:4-amino-4-deoxy-L-arabinose transferase-like glycosyltransferase